MPRLQGVRVRNPLDVYDCFSPTALARDKSFDMFLFGITNIGIPTLSNMQVPRTLASDQTAVILNVRARTNILPTDSNAVAGALRDFEHATQVALCVGERPCRNYALADLMHREPMDKTPFKKPDGSEGLVDTTLDPLAEKLYRARYHGQFGDGPWAELPEPMKEQWRSVVKVARQEINPNLPVIIPVRQTFNVLVSCEARSLRKLAEVLVGNAIAPQPLIWIHLEGVSCRDVG